MGQEYCDGECADTLNDDTNCGACGVTCAYDEFCDTGACAAICPGVGQELCDGECADTLNDTLNCGACGVTCAYDELCDAGACAPICPGVGQEYCDDSCVDTLQDPTNCGACGTACAGDEYCDGGSCEPVCAAGLTLCGMICVDLQNDPLHCGSCGNSCGSNDICGAATCTTCRPPQQTACDNVCVNIHTDPDNCGGCGNVCDFSDCPSGGVGTCSQGMSCICDGTDEADGSVSAPSYFPPVSTEQPESAVRLSVPKIDNSSTPPRPVVKPRPLPTKPRPLPVKVNVERADRMRNAEQSSAMANSVPTRPRPLPVKVSVERADRNRSVEQSSARPRSLPRRSGLGKAEPQAARRGKRRSTAVEQQKPNSSQLQRTSNASPTVEEAPVCEFQEPIEEIIIPDGETYIQCQTGTVLGAEVFTRASVVRDGQLVGVGPCAVFVPVPDVVVDDFYATTTAVILQDASGDGLLQPGEQADLYISLLNVGPLELMNPVVTLSGPPDQFNPTEVTVIADTAFFPDFPPFESVADCETPPVLEPQMALTPFTIVLPEEHEPDVGRALHLTITGDNVGPVTFELPLIIGIGEKCDPTNLDGETYDGLDGFLSPLNVDLVPRGTAVNYSDSAFGRGSLIPLRLKLKCGALTLQPDEIDPKPRIISIVHDTLGPLPLALINVDFGPFPISPFFHCGELQCEFNMNSRNLPAGTYVVGVEMADSRVFEAGFTLSDIELPGDG